MNTETADDYRTLADALEDLAAQLRDADSIADDVPVLSEMYHTIRTSSRNARDGRYVALLDYDPDGGGWSCRSVTWLETGAHYRDPSGDALVSFKPWPFCEVDRFAEAVANGLKRDAKAARQSAGNIEHYEEMRDARQ